MADPPLDPALVAYCEAVLAGPMPEAVWDHIVDDMRRVGDHAPSYWLEGIVCLHGCVEHHRHAA